MNAPNETVNTNSNPDLNPIERYYQRVLELAKTDPELKALMPDPAVKEAARKPGLSYAEIIATVLDGYAERPACAERTYALERDAASGKSLRQYLPQFTPITYADLRTRVEALACAWREHPQHRVKPEAFICLLGFSGIDYLTVELAAVYAHAVTVPLQSSLAGTDLGRIFADCAPAAIAATVDDLMLAVQLAAANGAIHSIIAIEYEPRDDDHRAKFEAAQAEIKRSGANIHLIPIQELIAFGCNHQWKSLPAHPLGEERMASLVHSSGSTGVPKGAIIPERISKSVWVGGLEQVPTVQLIFAPMNHFMGRAMIFGTLTLGGTVYFTVKPDLSTFFEDMRLVRPTYTSFFPRIFELIWQHFQSEVVRRAGDDSDIEKVRQVVKQEMGRGFLGDRLRGGSIGSAPTTPEVKQFVRECFDIMLLEGYGTTEAGGGAITFEGRVLRPPIIDYKLDDVPELGYYKTDKPYPRGELCVKSMLAIPGYFKRPEESAKLVDADGYMHTGDIMEERAPDVLVYIDRRNDVLKLSQAEFVAVGPLGATFESGSPVIKQIYVYGNSARSYLLAVVVPEMEVVTTRIGKNPSETALRALIREELQKVGKAEKLRTFEIPRDFIIEMEPFSFENGLLSSVRKRMRPNIKRKYVDRLEALYAQIEAKRLDDLMALKNPGSTLTVLEKVVKALEATLGIEGIDASTPRTFADLGGDSLGAISFSLFLEDIFGVEVAVTAILSPAGNLQKWAQAITAAKQNDRGTPTFRSLHGKDATTLHAKDLDIDKFLDKRVKVPAGPPMEKSRVVLLTGASGFLGHILCLEWMEKLSQDGGKVICLIRGKDNADARKRLDSTFEGFDAALEQRYRALAAKHLEVLAADVAEPRFGLSEAEFARLAREVDRIVHPAALVNHMLPYEHLFGPNVFGTAELIRLALTHQQKRFDFVSSAAVTLLVDTTHDNNEDSPLLESVALGNQAQYAAGYGASKWACEVLLQSAHQRYGLPVNIYRCDMIMPHSRYQGQINVPDMFTRLLFSIVMTGLAPESFYEFEADGSRARAHYDGLPVDFVASAIVESSLKAHRELKTYNALNPHDDGISLDSLADWVASAGYKVERVRDHAQWIQRFEAKLSTLTEEQRQHSSLVILGMWRQPHPAHPAPIGCDHFLAAVRDVTSGSGGGKGVPHLSEAYIHKYLNDMRLLGLIGTPR